MFQSSSTCAAAHAAPGSSRLCARASASSAEPVSAVAEFTAPSRQGTSIHYTRTPNGRTSRLARNLLVSGVVIVKPLLTNELPLELFDQGIALMKRNHDGKN